MASKPPGDRATEGKSNEVRLRQTCDACQAIKTRCSRGKPSCARCLAHNIPCHYGASRRIGRPRRLALPPSSVPSSHVRKQDKQITVRSQSSSGSTGNSQPASGFYTDEWNSKDVDLDVDIDVDNDKIIADDSETPSNGSSDAVERDINQNDRSATPTVAGRRAPISSIATSAFPSPQAQVSGLNDQDLFSLFFENDISRLPSSSLSSSLTNDVKIPSRRIIDDLDIDRQSSLLLSYRQHMEQTQFTFTPSEHELDISAPFGWEFSNDAWPPPRESPCRCLESALSVALSIRQGQVFLYAGAMDLALDVEAQLRETVPVAVRCSACKGHKGEILKLFSNAMADAVDLLQRLCNAEFSDAKAPPPKTSSSDQHELQMGSGTGLNGWRVLVGQHLIVGDDRKFVLMHLLRRRLHALANVLECLIRAMQDLRTALKREESLVPYDDEALNRSDEIDTRKSMKTASKLYDIIDQLEKVHI
ncbi:putative AflR-like C6 transcription factor [Xylogone sp. PMI_703]|nr:putative AflR-like C6 transcription factor [Xylogone sp. PMI_703]